MIIPAAIFNKNPIIDSPPFKQKERNDNIFILTHLNLMFVPNKFQYCILKMSMLFCWKKFIKMREKYSKKAYSIDREGT